MTSGIGSVAFTRGGNRFCLPIGDSSARPSTKVLGRDPEPGTPPAASLRDGQPETFPREPSFDGGAGSSSVGPEMWIRLEDLAVASVVGSPDRIAGAARPPAERQRVIGEEAAAIAFSAARTGQAGRGRVAGVRSGGNIDTRTLVTILQGRTVC